MLIARDSTGTWTRASGLRQQSAHTWPGGVHDGPLPPAKAPSGGLSQPHRASQQRSNELEDVRSQLLRQEDPGPIIVNVDGEGVPVLVDPEKGPRLGREPNDFVKLGSLIAVHKQAKWESLNLSMKEYVLVRVAKKVQFWRKEGVALASSEEAAALEDIEAEQTPEELEVKIRQRIEQRCREEAGKPTMPWATITIDTVTKGCRSKAPGMFYALEFPWTEAMLLEWGPEWLTKAFHAAGTLELDNAVTKLIPEKKVKVTTGNNGGKFLFDVKYAKKRAHLHTRLFGKVPFPLDGVTRSDRLSSSVNKQPQEFYEINTSRLLEAVLPVKTPRFYYGDISNESTNWILITECVAFADPAPLNFGTPGRRRKALEPFMIEGPYDKCIDHNLRGKPSQYYMLLVVTGAKIAGLHKAGKMGSEELLNNNFLNMAGRTASSFGLSVGLPSGEDARTVKPKLETALPFLYETGKVLFPEYVTQEWCTDKLKNLLLTVNAYSGEVMFWKHSHPDYIALSHSNLNVDNAYFWRNAEGKLELGVFDWGNMGAMSVGHKLWWWLYCMDFEIFRENVWQYVDAFIASYAEHGGPHLDRDRLYRMIILTSLEQMLTLMFAVPQIFKMCPKYEWATIEDRYDPRIAENVDGKSTLRLYLHVINSIIRIIEEMEGDKVLQQWIETVWMGEFKVPAKSQDAIQGLVKAGPGL